MSRLKRYGFGLAGVAAAGLFAMLPPTSARADVAILCQTGAFSDGNSATLDCSGGQGNSLTNEQILFSSPGAVTGPSSTVTGVTSVSNALFDFSSTTDTLLVNNAQGGNATIASTNTDNTINNLSYQLQPGQTFTSYTVLDTDLQTNLAAGQTADVIFTINALNSLGQAESFTSDDFLLVNGQNNFTFIASNGEVITSVTFNATDVQNIQVLDVKQTSVNLGTGTTTVPEPASLAIFGTALTGLGLLRRRRRNKV